MNHLYSEKHDESYNGIVTKAGRGSSGGSIEMMLHKGLMLQKAFMTKMMSHRVNDGA